ncbi:MAG: GAF domain-containing protein [Actinomycetaceae bacterium]|nr:GAF domain-containing protein [Actinomycetaceae bacterium]MDU0970078.1 GAF domain-containing protein [Actinomycetaceae bacterium]
MTPTDISSFHRVSLDTLLSLIGTLKLDAVLQRFVDVACEISDSPYGALSVLDNRGETAAFYQHGLSPELATRIGHPPVGRGVIGQIPVDDGIIINDLAHDPAFTGFPDGHPTMTSFLGAPLRIHEQVYGRLYLCDKPGGYRRTDLEDLRVLAAIAAVAVENSQLYEQARAAEQWIRVSQQLTTTLLEGADEEDALALITERIRSVAKADTALMILPSVGDTWACEFADGALTDGLIGMVFPPNGRAMTVLREGQGLIVDSMQRATTMRVKALAQFGPALYAPLLARGKPSGVLLLLRLPDREEFSRESLAMAESVASQAALALELASARHAEDLASLLDERTRIGEDLHDLAIQQLFATGMVLAQIKDRISSGESVSVSDQVAALDNALASVDDSVKQIRSIVHNLRDPDPTVILVERLRRETSLARNALGFAPSLVLSLDNQPVSSDADDGLADAFDARIGPDRADDVVAVVREALSNAARHAHASSVQVTVAVEGEGATGHVWVHVADDGRGLDPRQMRRSGLENLASRARRHGGTFTMTPSKQGGLAITWRVPLT